MRMIQRFHEELLQRMSPERRARKLSVMKALARASFRSRNKENEDPLNNNMALPFRVKHSTPLKSSQITDLDVEPEREFKVKEAEHRLGSEREVVEVRENREEEPQLVIAKMHYGSSEETFRNSLREEPLEVSVTYENLEEVYDKPAEDDSHWRSLEVLGVTAEDEFFRSLEQSKLFVSTSSLLEEIEADLPSPYSLARPLNHTFHTLSSYRTVMRLARMETNLTCPSILEQRESLEAEVTSTRLENLEKEAVVQNSLARQAEKALALSRSQKSLGVEHVECEKTFLLTKLRYNATIQEAQRLKMFGETTVKENFGQLTISEMFFAVKSSLENSPGQYICTATERENVQSTSIIGEVTDGLLHFDEPLKFQNLGKHFLIYIELFKLHLKEPKRAMLPTSFVRKLRKMTVASLNRSLTDTSEDHHWGDFERVACAELRMDQIAGREAEECLLYFSESPRPPIASSSVRLLVETDVQLKSKRGFLNVFRQTWHRRWFLHSGYSLESWLYPEDQETGKDSLESFYLATCVDEVKPGGLDVCVRPNSFVLTVGANEEVLFSADSHKDMLSWIAHLNLVIEHIRLWKPTL